MTDPLKYSFTTIEDGRIEQSEIRIADVDPFLETHTPAVLAPDFVLGKPGGIRSRGLHHNAEHYVDRHRKQLASDPAGWLRHTVPDDEVWFLLGGHPNYYHFIVNYCARLHYYLPLELRGHPTRRFVVADNLPQFYYRYLELLGIESNALIRVPSSAFLECSRLVVSNLPLYFELDGGLHADPSAFGWLRKCLIPKQSAADRGEKIFLTRKHAGHRRIVDEDELFAVAARHGYVRMCPEDLSLADLLETFSRAGSLVTTFGAGATNSLWCPQSASVIELIGANAVNKLNGPVLCALAQQPSVRVVAEESNTDLGWQYRDLRVNQRDFETALELAATW